MSVLKMKKTVLPKTANKSDQIASEFFEWTTKEIKCWKKEKENEPQENVFKMICRGKMLELAKFLTEHIHSDETVFKTNRYILLKEHSKSTANMLEDSFNSEMQSIQLKKKQLKVDTKIINANIRYSESDIENLKQNWQKKDKKLKKSKEKIRCFRNKRRIFHRFCEYSQRNNNLYLSYLQNIERTNKNDNFRLKAKSFQQLNISSFEPEKTPSEKKLGKIKKIIEKKISDFLEDKTEGEGNYGNQIEKDIFPFIQKLLQLFDSYLLKDGLLRLYRCGNKEVQVTTASVNINEDAKNMWYRCESQGKFVDEAKSQTLKDVSHLLLEEHVENVTAFLEKYTTEQNNQNYLQQINDFQRQIDAELKNRFATNNEMINLIRRAISADLSAVGSEATFENLLDMCSNYKQEIVKEYDEHLALEEQVQNIKYFNEIAEINKNIVLELFAEITVNLPQLLCSARLQNVSFVKEKILKSSNVSCVNELCLASHSCIHDFQALELNHLLKNNMYINQELSVSNIPRTSALDGSKLRNIRTTFLKSEESMLQESLLTEGRISSNSSLTVLMEKLSSTLHLDKKEVVIYRINELIRKVKDYDTKQLDILSELKSKFQDLDALVTVCKSLERLMEDWLNQPAQFALPDYKIDGFNLKEWTEYLEK